MNISEAITATELLTWSDDVVRFIVKPGLHSVRRTYATEMRKRIYADPRVGAFKVDLYFRRLQALPAPPHVAPVRTISWRGPAGANVRQCRGKKYKRTRV